MNKSLRDAMPSPFSVAEMQRRLAGIGLSGAPEPARRVAFGIPAVDAILNGGLLRAALHEIHAPGTADLATATGFALGLAWRAAEGRPILWVRQDMLDTETGKAYPPGLVEIGLDPERFLLVKAGDASAALRAGAEGARCPALGAVLIEPMGEPRQLDLTTSRRLALGARNSGVMTLLLRAARPQASAAHSRWLVEARPSRAREANAPGDPAFRLRLLRQRGGLDQGEWRVEWNRDRRCFQEATEQPAVIRPERSPDATPLSRLVVAFPADGPSRAPQLTANRRRTG